MNEEFILSLLLSLVFTPITYLAVPITWRIKMGRQPVKTARIICIINAASVALIWAAYHFIENMNINFAPALIWYFVGYAILREKIPINKNINIKECESAQKSTKEESIEEYPLKLSQNLDSINADPHNMKAKINCLSVISLIVSILGVIIYGLCFNTNILTPVFIILAISSIILPIISKIFRFKRHERGAGLEITSIVIGGFNFYCIIFAFTEYPIFIGFLGWIVSGIVYKLTDKYTN